MEIVAGDPGRRNFLRTGLGGAIISLSSCNFLCATGRTGK